MRAVHLQEKAYKLRGRLIKIVSGIPFDITWGTGQKNRELPLIMRQVEHVKGTDYKLHGRRYRQRRRVSSSLSEASL